MRAVPIFLLASMLLALPAARATADSGEEERLLLDFARPVEARAWRAALGPRPRRSSLHPTRGRYSLWIQTGAILRSRMLPSDWSAYEVFEFSVFHAGEAHAECHVMIGDRAWERNRTYWNRYNASFSLRPGPNTIRIPVQGLFRGESGSRNNDIPGPVDPRNIVRVDLSFIGVQADLYLDQFRLVRVQAPPGVRAFDFGPKAQSVWPGFTAVTWNTLYSPETGYGLNRAAASANRAGDTAFPTPLLQDFLWMEGNEFIVDVEPGEYQLFWTFEDSGYWSHEQARHHRRSLQLNDQEIWSETRPDGEAHAYFRFADHEPEPTPNALAYYYDALYTPHSVAITSDGTPLRFRFEADARWSTRLSSLAMVSRSDTPAREWIANAYNQNRRFFLAQHPSAHGERELARARDGDPLLLRVREVPWEEGHSLFIRGAPSETVLLPMRFFAGESTATLHVSPLQGNDTELPANRISVWQARRMAKRARASQMFQIVPWYLEPADPIEICGRMGRDVSLSISIPEAFPAGHYQGTVQIEHLGDTRQIPLHLEVLPIELEPLSFPLALFQMEPSMFPLLREYGFTAACGGPGIAVRGFDEEGQPRLDTSAVDAWMEEARAHGFVQQAFAYPGPGHFEGMSPYNTARVLERWAAEAGLTPAETARRLFAARADHAERADWIPLTWIAFDEPRSRSQAETLLPGLALLREAAPELRTLGYYNVNPRARSDPFLHRALYEEIQAVASTLASPSFLRAVREDGKEAYLYNFGRNRYAFGLGLWLARQNGVRGLVQWHAWIVHGFQFFDFDGREPDDGLLVRTRDGWRPTLQLEEIRKGIDDHRYAEALMRAIGDAREAGRSDAADKAERAFETLLQPLSRDSRYPPHGFDQDAARERMVELLLRLTQAAADEEPVTLPPR